MLCFCERAFLQYQSLSFFFQEELDCGYFKIGLNFFVKVFLKENEKNPHAKAQCLLQCSLAVGLGLLSPEDFGQAFVTALPLIKRHFGALSYLDISC